MRMMDAGVGLRDDGRRWLRAPEASVCALDWYTLIVLFMTPDLSIDTLLSLYHAKATTPRKVLRALWDRAAAGDKAIWISRPSWEEIEGFLTKLESSDPESLPLYGIPFAIKDNIDQAGHPTTAACPAFAMEAASSAFVVQKLIDAGAIPVGKTNLDQFATGLVGVRSPYGVPANSFDPAYIPGGSSSGSAVAVAAGLASFALGTDTAGSGRVPASFNNLVGLKPTRGVLSCSGLVPACRSLDCPSVFALSVSDAMRVYDVVAAFDPSDAYARQEEEPTRRPRASVPVIGMPKAEQLAFFGDESARALFQASVARLAGLGWRTREVDFAPFLEAARLLYEGPWVAERYLVAGDLLQSQPEALHPVTRQIIEGGAKPLAVDAFRAQYRLAALKRASEAVWEEVDAILTPTAGTIYKVAEVEADPIKLNSNLGYYTNFMNLLDLCAWAVPAGFLSNRLPWGVTFFAPAFEDRPLAELAAKFHAAVALPVGTTTRMSHLAPPVSPPAVQVERWMQIAVCGAHMHGLALNHQLITRGARMVSHTTTAPVYRSYLLPGNGKMPDRPGLVRVTEGGASIEAEVWELPEAAAASFIDAVPRPLGFGRVELADGSHVCGFLCEPYAVSSEHDITHHGGWRAWLESAGKS